MESLSMLIGPVLLIAPLAAVVIWLMVATRRPSCPKCSYGVSRGDTRCPRCGERLELGRDSQRQAHRQSA